MATKLRDVNLSLVTNDITSSVKSFQLSKRYVKRLLKIGTLNIIYQRIDIPEPEFEQKKYENVPYVIFRHKSKNKFIRNYHVFIQGVVDAMDKDFLKEIFLFIRDKITGRILESYTFKVSYMKDETPSSTKPSKVRNSTIEFLQAFASIPGEKWSSDKVELFMEFSYNEGTPREYEPPYFEPAGQPLCMSLHSNAIVQLGRVNTGFHKVSAWGRGENFTQSTTLTPACLEEIVLEDLDDSQDNQQKAMKNKTNDNEDISQRKKVKVAHNKNDSVLINITNDKNIDNITIVSSEDYASCMCKWDLPKEFETARCTKCHGNVHLACHGYLKLNSVNDDSFLCYLCSDFKTNTIYMNKLVKLRIILYGIYLNKELPVELELATQEERNYILGQLDKLEVYSYQANSRCDINVDKLNKALVTAFAIENSQYLE